MLGSCGPLSWRRLAALALLLLSVPSPAGEARHTLSTGGGLIAGVGSGEEWIDLSVDLTPAGEVVVNGRIVGTYCPAAPAVVDVSAGGAGVLVVVRDARTGGLFCVHEEPYGSGR